MSQAEHKAISSKKHKYMSFSDEISIAVSLGALFILENYNPEQDIMPTPGPALPFVKALREVKNKLEEQNTNNGPIINIIITIPAERVSERVSDQLKANLQEYGQLIRADNERDLFNLLKDKNTKLYLSINPHEVINAIHQNLAAATLKPPATVPDLSETQLRVAFDGDGVIFSDEAEAVFKEQGLKVFKKHELDKKEIPLHEGPLKCFLEVLVKLQENLENCPIRTFLVTSRGALSSGYRVLNTLRSWGLNINEMFFLQGSEKCPILQAIKPHLFFDDQMKHVDSAVEAGVIAAHVPYGIAQQHN